MQRFRSLLTPHYFTVAGLILVWLAVLAALPAVLPLHAASWLAFLALLVAPGYLLGDMIAWKLNLDAIERLALALPLGVAILAIPGIIVLLLHLDVHQLAFAWALFSGAIIVAWFFHEAWIFKRRPRDKQPWQADEILLLVLILVAFIAIVPTLNLYKIDGDAYAVNSFVADALAELPLNEKEPLFGTDLGPGVRMVFNQSLALYYLWSYFSVIDANTLIAASSKAMLALWAIFASYTLGKAAGNGQRRFGLLTAAIQLLIFMAAPFFRGDNVSIFYFERINADKFMVPVTMLPVIFALAMRFLRDGVFRGWLAAAVATFAVSTIHPLIAAMLALALGTFALLHLLMNLRRGTAWLRVAALGGLVAIVMFLPLVQLVISQGEAPLASSYPRSLEDWDVGEKQVPALPFFHVGSLDYYGPLPEMSELEATDAYEAANPFLIWRFALNMDRRRLILFDLDRYISDPSLIIEPPYFLALLLLPMFLWRLRRDVAAQFVVAVSLGVVFVMFNPVITPLVGSFVMPWILWRFVWILPYALIFAMALDMILGAAVRVLGWVQAKSGLGDTGASAAMMTRFLTLVLVVLAALVLSPGIVRNIKNLNGRVAFAYTYPTPEEIFRRLNAELATQGPAMVLAEQDLSVTLPAFVAHAEILAHRTPTTSEVFPADQQHVALQRLIDQDDFFNTPYLAERSVATLQTYDVRYVIAENGSGLDLQMRMAPQWFDWLADDEAYSLYAVKELPAVTETIKGNTAMAERDWVDARRRFERALAVNEADMLAQVGLAEIAQREGDFDEALSLLQATLAREDLPVLHYRLGQLYAQQGHIDKSIGEFDLAQTAAPQVANFHIALGDACLDDGLEQCAAVHYQQAVEVQEWPDGASKLIAEADLWRQRGLTQRALPLYLEAAEQQPNEYNLFVLVSVYRELGLFAEAAEVIRSMRLMYPLSAEVIIVQADLASAQGDFERAVNLLRGAIWLQELQVQETTTTHLALGQVLLDAGRLEEAGEEIAYAVNLNPYTASAHTLRGEIFHARGNHDAAVRAYQRAFELDPTQIGVYVALSNELRQNGGTPKDVMVLLQIALREDAEESTLLLALGDQFQRLGEADDAIDAYQAAVEQLAPYGHIARNGPLASDDSRAFAFSRIAGTYEDLGETQAAMNYYQSAVAAAPESAWTYLLLGDALRRQNDSAAAVEAYETALALDTAFIEAYLRLADLYTAAGEEERAGSLYERALELSGAPVAQHQPAPLAAAYPTPGAAANALFASDETLVQATHKLPATVSSKYGAAVTDLIGDLGHGETLALGQIYLGRSQGEEALQLYLQRLKLAEDSGESPTILARYHKELGDLYLVRGQLEKAMAAYEESVALDSWSAPARIGLAEALALQGDEEAGLDQLLKAVSLSPGAVEAQIALANALDQQARSTEAMTIYVNTARNHPGSGQATLALARAWQARNRWDQAEASFRGTMLANPGAADAYVGLAELRLDAGDYVQAEKLLTEAMRIDHNNVSSYIRFGELEQRRGDTAAALRWYQQAAALPAADQALNLTLIDSLIRYGDYETALSYTNQALQQRPDDPDLLLRRGRIEGIYGRYEDALSSFTAVQAGAADSILLYLELAKLYLTQGDLPAAISAYQQAIALEPQEATHYVAAAQLMAILGVPDQAEELLMAGLSQVSAPALIYDALADLHLQQGRPGRALELLNTGLSELGDNTQMFLAMGSYYVNRGNLEQVMERYDQALKSQPDIADVHTALGDLYVLMEDLDEAALQYRQAITIDPTTPGHYLALGNTYELAGDLAQAENAYKQGLIAAPTLVNGYLSLSNLYQEQERWVEAEETYEQGLEMAPASGALMAQYATLKVAQDKQDEALALLDQAATAEPSASTLIRRAAVYEDLGMLDEAQADLEAVLGLEPAAVEALVALGDLYKAEGEALRAQDYYLRAVTAMPGVPTGYLRMATMAREAENRDAVVYWNDLARQAEPGGLLRPEEPAAAE